MVSLGAAGEPADNMLVEWAAALELQVHPAAAAVRCRLEPKSTVLTALAANQSAARDAEGGAPADRGCWRQFWSRGRRGVRRCARAAGQGASGDARESEVPPRRDHRCSSGLSSWQCLTTQPACMLLFHGDRLRKCGLVCRRRLHEAAGGTDAGSGRVGRADGQPDHRRSAQVPRSEGQLLRRRCAPTARFMPKVVDSR